MSTNRDSIRIKRGMSAELPESLPLGELAFCIDTRELWVGSGDGLALKRVTNTEITQHLDEWNALYTEVDERFETKYVDVSAQFSEKFNELCQQFATKSDALDTQFANKYNELSQQFQNKYNNLEREYAQQVHSAMTLSADNKQSIDLLKRDIGTTANIEDLRQLNNQATETLEQLNQVKTELEGDVLVIKDIEKDTKNAHIDYEGNHHDSLKDSMDANIDFIKGEFNTTHMTGENITCENTILRHVKQAELKGHSEVNLIQEPCSSSIVLPYEFEEAHDINLTETKNAGSLSIELKGETELNIVTEPIRNYVVPYEFEEGTRFLIKDSKKTGSVSGSVLQGNTLVNLVNNDGYEFSTQSQNLWSFQSDNYLQLDANPVDLSYQWCTLTHHSYSFKPNTKYLIVVDVETNTHTKPFNFDGYNTNLNSSTGFISYEAREIGIKKAIVTTNDESSFNASTPIFRTPINAPDGCRIRLRIMAIEYVEGMENMEIPFFTGMKSISNPTIITKNKNLFNPTDFCEKMGFRQLNGGFLCDKSVTKRYPFKTTGRSILTLKHTGDENATVGKSIIQVNFTDGTKAHTSLGNLKYIFEKPIESIHVNCWQGGTVQITEMMWYEVDEGETTYLDYQPHNSTTLTCNEEVILRGISNVRDTLDTRTGKLTKRIGESILNGNESWYKESTNANCGDTEDTCCFYTSISDLVKQSHPNLVSDSFPFYNVYIYYNRYNHEGISSPIGDRRVFIRINKSRLETQDVTGFKKWLSENPVTIQYEVETPIITKIDLSINEHNKHSVPQLKTYNEVTQVTTYADEGHLVPIVSSQIPEFDVIAKTGTTYSIIADVDVNGHAEVPLTYNLCGETVESTVGNKVSVLKSPSSIPNQVFKITGTGMKIKNLMIVQNDRRGKPLPLCVDGMQGAKNPILRTLSKNLANPRNFTNEPFLNINGDYYTNGNSQITVNNDQSITLTYNAYNSIPISTGLIPVKPNNSYRVSESHTSDTIRNLNIRGITYFDKELNIVGGQWDGDYQKVLVTPHNAHYVNIGFTFWDVQPVDSIYTIPSFKFQIEENTEVTTIQSHDSCSMSFAEDITLNRLGAIYDTYDVNTQEFTQRVGVIRLDDNDKLSYDRAWGGNHDTSTDFICSCCVREHDWSIYTEANANAIMCDKLVTHGITSFPQQNNGRGQGFFLFKINKKTLGIENPTNQQISEYIKSLNATVLYPLATPIVKKVNCKFKNYSNGNLTKLFTFNNLTHITTSVPTDGVKPIISHKDLSYDVLLNPNKQYSIIFKSHLNNHVASPVYFNLGGTDVETMLDTGCALITTPNTLTHSKLIVRGRGNSLQNGVMVLEGNKTGMNFNQFEGIESVEEFTVKVANNNLFNKDYYDWSKYSGGTGQITGIHEYGGRKNCIFTNPALFPQFTHVKPNKQYTVKFDTLKLDDNGYGFLGVEFNYTDGTREQVSRVWGNEGVWKTSMATSNASKQIKSIKIQNASNGNWGAFIDLDSFVIVEGTSIPQVESRHNSLPLIIPLRSLPNGVSDTLNLVTGEYVQRVAEHVLDGTTTNATNDWRICWGDYSVNTVTFEGYKPNPLPLNRNSAHTTSIPSYLISDKIKVLGFGSMWKNGEAVDRETSLTTYTGGQLIFVIDKDKLETQDVTGFKKWLSENPVTIQYEVETPIVTKLDLAWKDGKLFAYDGKTHIYVDVEGNKLQPMLDIHVPVNIVAELSRLRQEKEQLEISKTQLENQLSLIQYHNSDLVSNVENLVAENLMLKQQTQDLQNNSSVLQLKNRELSKHQEKLRNENLELQKRAKALTHTTENLHHKLHVVDSVREAGDLELLSSDFELDFRLMEIEFALDIPISLSVKGVSSMARTPFEMAKTLILGGKYEREDMENKLKVYRDRGKITLAEYDELVALMDANELA